MNRNILGYLFPAFHLKNRIARKTRIRVLMFHDVPSKHYEEFERKVIMIKQKYNVIDYHEFQSLIHGKKKSSSKVNILFTFDDGFQSNFELSQILKKHGIKGVFFIAPEFIQLTQPEKQREFIHHNLFLDQLSFKDITDEMGPLTWEQIGSMEKDGHTIGAHTMSHAKLSMIEDKNKIDDEIVNSKNVLEDKLGHPVMIMAYPFGDITSISRLAVDQIKPSYSMLFSAVRGFNTVNTGEYEIKRDQADVTMTDNYLRFIIEGGLDIKYKNPRRMLNQMTQ